MKQGNDGTGFDVEETLIDSVRYENVLRSLGDGGMNREEIQDAADISSSTAYRLLNSLTEKGIVEKTETGGGVYELTSVGEVVLDEVDEFRSSMESIAVTKDILKSARVNGIEMDHSLFEDATVTVSELKRPYEPVRRVTELVRGSDEMRLLTVSNAVPVFSSRMRRLITDGREVEMVCPMPVVKEGIKVASPEMREELKDRLDIHAGVEPPFILALFESRVAVGGHDDEAGTLEFLVDTDDDGAYGWGDDVYQQYLEESERVEII
ncbi:MAG: helix-turn-helix domain-containing protein [Halobacteria archaeon]|nr:helix-turn-helix domain-containing protein [Halobacteria archaeon]